MATYMDLARRILPNESERVLGAALWNETAYPMAGVLTIARQLKIWGKRKRGGWSSCMACGRAFRYPGGRISCEMCDKCKNWWEHRND